MSELLTVALTSRYFRNKVMSHNISSERQPQLDLYAQLAVMVSQPEPTEAVRAFTKALQVVNKTMPIAESGTAFEAKPAIKQHKKLDHLTKTDELHHHDKAALKQRVHSWLVHVTLEHAKSKGLNPYTDVPNLKSKSFEELCDYILQHWSELSNCVTRAKKLASIN